MTERINKKLVLVHTSGVELFPVLIKSRTTGNTAFHVSLTRNAKGQGTELATIDEVIKLVIHQGYKVRAQSLDGTVKGSYKIGDRSILAHRIDTSDE